jgi:hypothetical protein
MRTKNHLQRNPQCSVLPKCCKLFIWGLFITALCLGLVFGAESPSNLKQTPLSVVEYPGEIPPDYQKIYHELDRKLQSFDNYLNSSWNGEKYPVILGAELIAANAYRGEELLTEKAFQGILLYLEKLKSLGVQCVKVTVSYPILEPDFPRSGEYLEFYKRLAPEIKHRGIKLLIGSGIMFSDPAYTNLKPNYKDLTWKKYQAGKRHQVETLIKEIHPDYITIANEPSTESILTGLKPSVSSFTSLVQFVLKGLDRRGVMVGAGTGTWDDPSYIESLSKNTDLDYIDLHIYPINNNYLERAVKMADLAKLSRKKIVVGEAWLYKTTDQEVAGASDTITFQRDIYSFWQPLDRRFLNTVFKLANYKQFELISAFWSKYFWGYLPYNQTTKNLSPVKSVELANQESVRNMLTQKVTQTGLSYLQLSSPLATASHP